MITRSMEKFLDKLDDISIDNERSIELMQFAAEIVNRVDPTEENVKAFFKKLDDPSHSEIVSRAYDENDRDQ